MDKRKSAKNLHNFFADLKRRPIGSTEKTIDRANLRRIAEEAVKNGIPIRKIPSGKTGRKG